MFRRAFVIFFLASPAFAAPPVAVVNGESIPKSELDAALAARPPVVMPLTAAQTRAIQQEALAALIDDLLLRQFLKKNAPPVSKEDVDRQVAALQRGLAAQGKPLDEYLKENHQTEAQLRATVATMQQWNAYAAKKVTDAELQKYFAETRDFFDKTTVRASHIVIRISPDAPAVEREEAKKKLQALRSEILAKKLTFAEAAMKHSQCPSAPKGGDLDFIARKWMVEEPFAKAAFALKVGEVSEVVTTDLGLHLVTVTERKPGTAMTFDAVADEVRECLLEDLRQRTLSDLRQAATVEIKLP